MKNHLDDMAPALLVIAAATFIFALAAVLLYDVFACEPSVRRLDGNWTTKCDYDATIRIDGDLVICECAE